MACSPERSLLMRNHSWKCALLALPRGCIVKVGQFPVGKGGRPALANPSEERPSPMRPARRSRSIRPLAYPYNSCSSFFQDDNRAKDSACTRQILPVLRRTQRPQTLRQGFDALQANPAAGPTSFDARKHMGYPVAPAARRRDRGIGRSEPDRPVARQPFSGEIAWPRSRGRTRGWCRRL